MIMAAPFHECTICKGKFRTLPGLQGHIRFRHKQDSIEVDKQIAEVKQRCFQHIRIALDIGNLSPDKAVDLVNGLTKCRDPQALATYYKICLAYITQS